MFLHIHLTVPECFCFQAKFIRSCFQQQKRYRNPYSRLDGYLAGICETLTDRCLSSKIWQKSDNLVRFCQRTFYLAESAICQKKKKEFVPVELHFNWLVLSNLLKQFSEKILPVQLSCRSFKRTQKILEKY